MKLTPNQTKAGSLVLVGIVGLLTGHYLPPDAMGGLVNGIAGWF